MRTVKVMVTAFRDGFQSVFGARVLTKDFLPALEAARHAGLTHFEVGGGARFQSLYFYCNEDAFDMMDACRTACGSDADLQTLGRGINVVGLESQSSDIIRMHAELFRKHGITTIRNFDALNDVANLDYSGRTIVDAGLKHDVCVTLMGLPPGLQGAHTADFYLDRIKQILDAAIPMHSLTLKDASGTATPQIVYDTVKLARSRLPSEVQLRFHTHDTAGTGVTTYKAAIEAGVEQIDLSMAPVSGGTAQPDIVTMWHALRGTDYQLDIDVDRVMEAEEVFKDCMKEYFFPPEALRVEPLIPFSPMPGGALTANTQMMRDHNVLDRFPEVIAAMREVVERGGFATSVTPVSQFYFQQAFNNVLVGPWKKIADGYGKMVLGYFGRTPTPPDPEIVELASKQLGMEPTDASPLELNDADPTKGRGPAVAMLEKESLPVTEENIFIAATCREKGIAFLKGQGQVMVRKVSAGDEGAGAGIKAPPAQKPASTAAPPSTAGLPSAASYTVTVDGQAFSVTVSENGSAAVQPGSAVPAAAAAAPAGGAGGWVPSGPAQGAAPQSVAAAPAAVTAAPGGATRTVDSPMPGSIFKVLVKPGDAITEGQRIIVIESMKMELDVESTESGTVAAVHVSEGEQVQAGTPLVAVQ